MVEIQNTKVKVDYEGDTKTADPIMTPCPTMTARPETLIHDREGRVNTGWPAPHFVQKVIYL